MDPQRIYVGRDISNLNRIVYRGLVTFPITDDAEKADTAGPRTSPPTPAPCREDAQDVGVHAQGRRQVAGRQARSPVRTSSTASRGRSPPTSSPVARTTSCPTSTSPKDKNGLPIYNGPYKGDSQAAFDKAVTCDGNTHHATASTSRGRTSHSRSPSLRAFDPYRKDKDQGEKSNYQIFSNGPYKLEGKWDATKGGTFVRNPSTTQPRTSPTTPQGQPGQDRLHPGSRRTRSSTTG